MSQKAPFMPLYVADYLADTGHLSTLEHGAYLLLLMHYWRVGKLPTEDRQLAHVTRSSLRQWQSIRPQIEPFFDAEWTHKRVEKERDNATKKASARADAGARGGAAKALKNKDRPLANATGLPKQNSSKHLPSSSDLIPEDKDKSLPSGVVVDEVDRVEKPRLKPKTIEELFLPFWEIMQPSRGKAPNPRKPAFEKFERLIRQGVPVEDIIGGAKRFEAIERGAGRWGTDKVAQAITWLNQHRWEGYGVEEAKPTPRATNGRHFVRRDSAQWWAWRDWMIAQGKRPISMTTNVDGYDGWYFETEWPPGALDAKKAPAEEPTPNEGMF